MGTFPRIFCPLLLVFALTVPIRLAAQEGGESGPKPGIPQTDQQWRGEALFMQNCVLCHIPSYQKKYLGIQAPTILVGAFRGEKPLTDANARRFIMEGIPRMMPAFKYTLDSKQLDNLIAYLKIR
jgi:mono/diheme cytochrome c family protein